MNVFDLRNTLVGDYSQYIRSFINIRDERIRQHVEDTLEQGWLWPEPLIQLNPSFEPGEWIDELVDQGVLHESCGKVFRIKPDPQGQGSPLRLHRHQADAVRTARGGHNYVLTTGTGSGKSLAYIVPIVDHIIRQGSGRGIRAIIVYPMNALANSQAGELSKFLRHGFPDGKGPVTFARYTGQESDEEKQRIIAKPPDILLTNYVMLELLLTRPREKGLISAAKGLQFLVLDELHTFRGRQGADVALLVRRVRDRMEARHLQCVGTSATMAGVGSYQEQRIEVAGVSSRLFGADIKPENVIMETLRRATPDRPLDDPSFVKELTERVRDPGREPSAAFGEFVRDPLSVWIETVFGITKEAGSGRLVRAHPKPISGEDGASRDLSRATGVPVDRCAPVIQQGLMAAYRCERNPETKFPPFAFRIHQFISRGDTVYASIEPEGARFLTVYGQQFVPKDRQRLLLPLVFCRECGQEYYCVSANEDKETGKRTFRPRELRDREVGDNGDKTSGFLYLNTKEPWPSDPQTVLGLVPDDWLEEHNGTLRLRPNRRDNLPREVLIGSDARETDRGLACQYLEAPFRFCLRCGVSYDFRQKSDFQKLASLASEGRSTATTILSLSAIRGLRRDGDLPAKARKLLSFTDNRQDASLQAGHLNDFVEIGLLRAALYRAARAVGGTGLRHEELTQKVFDALNLPLALYASDPAVRFQALAETQRALRDVLGYRLYRDLKRGWRLTSPNLEQCGLLEMKYLSLEDLCAAQDVWEKLHPALATAKPGIRAKVAKVLLDLMRRELAIKVDYLEGQYQEQIQQRSSQRLIAPWDIDESERMEHPSILFPRSSSSADRGDDIYLSARGGFGQYLRRPNTFEGFGKLKVDETQVIIQELLKALRVAGLVEMVAPAGEPGTVPGYQVLASAMLWTAGEGTRAFHDPIRVPKVSSEGSRTNPFFVHFYRAIANDMQGVVAREHTAQVPSKLRIEREEDFREARLPILYCSPTMELGVDISELNVVNMRNVPPTPANYAQRSGRAGRSGQPALVFSYCSTWSGHDQYFFKRPHRMVAGSVTPPRLDLSNEDLIRAHVHATWLAETGVDLGKSLKELLDLSGEDPPLTLLASKSHDLESEPARERAKTRAQSALSAIEHELRKSDWYSSRWLDEVLAQVMRNFDLACDRWRTLYRAALKQARAQDRVIRDASRPLAEKKEAERLRREAEAQLKLLTDFEEVEQSDFYSYRYFASEGFLPGYSFPRLPLSAYIPGRRKSSGRDEFLSRPRFLAITEFGPRRIIYHEGSRYIINKVILPVGENDLLTGSAKVCASCGYLHPIPNGGGPDLCEGCGRALDQPLRSLFRLRNVVTKRRDKISCDEEERLRIGYELRTSLRFAEHGGRPSRRVARVLRGTDETAALTYGQAATLWRINLGWLRRKNKEQLGFVLDTERGYWANNDQADDEGDADPLGPTTLRVVPYVEDRRNCLLIQPKGDVGPRMMASLQAAIKSAIQVHFELEDNELAAEPLPDRDERRIILLYEAAEGGAGVLRRLIDDPQAFAAIARRALEICHFDPATGEDRHRAPRSREDCEAACYDCLMSYSNQIDHVLLDRHTLKDVLMGLANTRVEASPTAVPRADHLAELLRLAGSELERKWLRFLEGSGLRLPSRAQVLIEACQTRPDFLYESHQAAIYIDGPPHEYAERQARDKVQSEAMEDQGYTVIRITHEEDWSAKVKQYPHIFGDLT